MRPVDGQEAVFIDSGERSVFDWEGESLVQGVGSPVFQVGFAGKCVGSVFVQHS